LRGATRRSNDESIQAFFIDGKGGRVAALS